MTMADYWINMQAKRLEKARKLVELTIKSEWLYNDGAKRNVAGLARVALLILSEAEDIQKTSWKKKRCYPIDAARRR